MLNPDQFKDAPNYQQLTMFEPLKKLRYGMHPEDSWTEVEDFGDPKIQEDLDIFWDSKLQESKYPTETWNEEGGFFEPAHDVPTLYDRLEKSPIHTPVVLGQHTFVRPEHEKTGKQTTINTVMNGQHRIAAAADIAEKRGTLDYEEVPVRWSNPKTGGAWEFSYEEDENKAKLTPREQADWKHK